MYSMTYLKVNVLYILYCAKYVHNIIEALEFKKQNSFETIWTKVKSQVTAG